MVAAFISIHTIWKRTLSLCSTYAEWVIIATSVNDLVKELLKCKGLHMLNWGPIYNVVPK